MRALGCYFLLSYLFSWLIWWPLYAPALGLPSWPALPFNHALGGLGPMLAAFATASLFHRSFVPELLRRMVRPGKPGLLLTAALGPFVLLVLCTGIGAVLNQAPFSLRGVGQTPEFPGWSLLSFTLYNILFFGFGEETGWRGYALPLLQYRMKALNAALVLTLFWALWHWPAFLYRPGYQQMGIAGISGWIVSLLAGSIFTGWLYNQGRGSVLLCALFHATMDVAFTSDLPDRQISAYMGAAVTIAAVIVVRVAKPRNLATRERQQLAWPEERGAVK